MGHSTDVALLSDLVQAAYGSRFQLAQFLPEGVIKSNHSLAFFFTHSLISNWVPITSQLLYYVYSGES